MAKPNGIANAKPKKENKNGKAKTNFYDYSKNKIWFF